MSLVLYLMQLTIQAADHGEPPMTSQATATISVKKAANASIPLFSQTDYSVTELVDLAVGSKIQTVMATNQNVSWTFSFMWKN